MVAFRKVFPVLVLMAIMAVTASAQNPAFQCAANAGVPPLVRQEGLTEGLGDLVLNCTGGPDNAQPYWVNITIFLTQQVSVTSPSGDPLVMIDDPDNTRQCVGASNSRDGITGSCAIAAPATNAANIWKSTNISGNSVTWVGVPIVPPGSVGSRIIRITNIRANVTGVVSAFGIPGSVAEYISITGSTSVPVANQPQTVAFVTPSLDIAISGKTGKQCKTGLEYASITFTEKFQTAFRKRIRNDSNGAPLEQDVPGYNYVTESIFTSAVTGSVGKATTGTRFVVSFKNIQKGVGVAVQNFKTNGELSAVLVSANSAGDGGSTPTVLPADDYTSVSLTGGAGYAVYEVMANGTVGDPPNQREKNGYAEMQAFAIGIRLTWTPNIGAGEPALGVSQVSGNYGTTKLSDKGAVLYYPTFKYDPKEGTLLDISACRTILLWPFVTNQLGFDTGMVVSNTSSDPSVLSDSAKRPQQGACTFYPFGTTEGGGAAPASWTSQVIPTGQHIAFTLSGGGTYGATGFPKFQGYVFAICEFQYAHGYAFITKQGAVDIAHGYLALIVPDRLRLAKAFSDDAEENDGEQLGY